MGSVSNIERCYEIFELKPGCSLQEIKQAYRRLAKTCHPDCFPHDSQLKQQAEEKIKQLNEAYEILKFHQSSGSPTSVASTAVYSTRPADVESICKQGIEKSQRGNYQEALKDFSKAIRVNPHYTEAYRYRSSVLSELGFENWAYSDLRKARELENLQQRQPSAEAKKPHSQSNSVYPPKPSSQSNRSPSSHTPAALPWKCVRTIAVPKGTVTSVAIHQNGKLLVGGSRDKTICLWNLQTGKFLCALTGHSAPVLSVAISANGQFLASGSEDQTIKIWHIKTGTLVRTLSGHSSSVRSIVMSPNQQILVSGSADRTVNLWNLAEGVVLRSLTRHSAPVCTVAISPDGQRLVTGSEDQTIALWFTDSATSLQNPNCYRKLQIASSVLCSAISPDGSVLATSSSSQEIQLWHLSSGEPIGNLFGHTNSSRTLVFSPNRPFLVSGSEDQTVKIWHTRTGSLTCTLTGHSGAITSLACSRDGQTLVSSSEDQTIKIWQCET